MLQHLTSCHAHDTTPSGSFELWLVGSVLHVTARAATFRCPTDQLQDGRCMISSLNSYSHQGVAVGKRGFTAVAVSLQFISRPKKSAPEMLPTAAGCVRHCQWQLRLLREVALSDRWCLAIHQCATIPVWTVIFVQNHLLAMSDLPQSTVFMVHHSRMTVGWLSCNHEWIGHWSN